MGTRARIAVKHPDNGTFASIYTHWDGYPSHHGPRLLKGYDTFEKVCELMALGDLSSLGYEIGTKHPFDNPHNWDTPAYDAWRDKYCVMCSSYRRDRGETGTEAVTSDTLDELKELTEQSGGEWLYLFDNGTWYCAEGGVGFFGMPTGVIPRGMRLLDEVTREEVAREASVAAARAKATAGV